MTSIATCTNCDWSKEVDPMDTIPAGCPECRSHIEIETEYSTPDETKTDKI